MSSTDTRNEAYFQHRDSGDLGNQQKMVMACFVGEHSSLTLREIAVVTGLDINAVSGRVNELKKAGKLAEDLPRACTITGRTVTPVKLPALSTSEEIEEQKALTAAREIWKKRDQITPSGSGTWRQWWEKRFGRNYDEYVAEMRQRALRKE